MSASRWGVKDDQSYISRTSNFLQNLTQGAVNRGFRKDRHIRGFSNLNLNPVSPLGLFTPTSPVLVPRDTDLTYSSRSRQAARNWCAWVELGLGSKDSSRLLTGSLTTTTSIRPHPSQYDRNHGDDSTNSPLGPLGDHRDIVVWISPPVPRRRTVWVGMVQGGRGPCPRRKPPRRHELVVDGSPKRLT